MHFRRKPLITLPLKILISTNGAVLFAGAMLGPIYALFVEKIGGDLMDASLAGAFFALAAGITVLLSGNLADRVHDPELVVVAGFSVMAIGYASFLAVTNMWSLFFAQILIGIGEALYSPAFDEVYSKHLDKKREGRQWAFWESTYYFTTFFGAIAGGFVASQFGFPVLFIIMSILCALAALYILHLPRKLL